MRLFHRLSGWWQSCFKPARGREDLQDLLEGYRGTALLYVAARLKIADRLAERPCSSRELAEILGAHGSSLHRVLRGLVVLGLCAESPEGVFQLTPPGRRLQSDGPDYNLAILNGEEYAAAWNHLLHSVTSGETAFDHVFGESPWEHRRNHPELNQRFNDWLEAGAAAAGRALANARDFPPRQTVADVGGGQGALLNAILQAHPSVQGILFDQPHVVSAARPRLEAAGLEARCRIIEGDFFKSVPPGADLYILKSILHDWDDRKCSVILENCRAVMKPGQAVLVVERIMPARAADQPSTVMGDLHMLAVTGGRERTVDEYRALFTPAGFELKTITPLSTGHSVLEILRA